MKKRKTRVTKELVHQMQDERKIKSKKNVVIPGPWTDIETPCKTEAAIKLTHGIVFDLFGAYLDEPSWKEKGWYPIVINIRSDDIKEKVQEFGIDHYIAAWEKSINSDANKKTYGTMVLLEVLVDHSTDDDTTHRFISCRAKTNKKSIKGFSAIRKNKYVILE